MNLLNLNLLKLVILIYLKKNLLKLNLLKSNFQKSALSCRSVIPPNTHIAESWSTAECLQK